MTKDTAVLQIGDVFGRLTVIGEPVVINKSTHYRCLCSCKKEKMVSAGLLKRGKTRSCGCLRRDSIRPKGLEVGKRFGRLTIISNDRVVINSGCYYHCICDCGNPKLAYGCSLKNGNLASCGCLARESSKECWRKTFQTHGQTGTRTYICWASMKRRCYNSSVKSFKYYGERGIKVCDRWLNSFENFIEDMGERPPGMTIDRIDNNKDYEPVNCRWATSKQQQNNRRNSRFLELNGEKHTISEWAEILDLPKSTMYGRFYRGENVNDILNPLICN